MKNKISNFLLGKAYITGSLPYVEFKEGNGISFGQDFSWWDELPANGGGMVSCRLRATFLSNRHKT